MTEPVGPAVRGGSPVGAALAPVASEVTSTPAVIRTVAVVRANERMTFLPRRLPSFIGDRAFQGRGRGLKGWAMRSVS
ncbi:hypothetical protein GCM10009801_66730 [Streptomyces albiaxialis]|uniref:Uncharacterized protein n=1 Tax=Streptomyces albiaxialis TaxID=329523 RepID=A0ABP5IBL2_9ACTN